eukprot:PITA_11907
MEAVLEDNGLKDFIDKEIPNPVAANAQELDEGKKCVVRSRWIILEGVRDHIVSSLHGKDTPYSMWKTLKDLYQNNSDQRKLVLKVARARWIILEGVRDHIVSSLHGKDTPYSMWKTLKDLYHNNSDQRKLALKDKLQRIKMENGDTNFTYLNKLTTYRYELGSVGIMTADDDMEEIRRSTRDGSSSKIDDEENMALASRPRKGKEKDSHPKSNSSHGGKKIDKSKVRCFNCHEVGHYATNCPLKKSKKGSLEGSECEALASQFELNFTLIACMVSSTMVCGWFLDSGASFHMTGDKSLFSTLEEKDLKMLIEMGDDKRFSVLGVGTVAFQREHGALITLTDVKYVLGLKKNLVSIAMLEEKGYNVVFSKGKVFLRHITTGHVK